MRCNQCDSLYINGIFCHEIGCPNSRKEYDKESGEWVIPEPEPEFEDEFDTYYQYECGACGWKYNTPNSQGNSPCCDSADNVTH